MMVPEKILALLQNKTGHVNTIGMSGSSVTIFDDFVRKSDSNLKKAEKTAAVMQWLDGRIAAPQLICYEVADGNSWLLMSKVLSQAEHYWTRELRVRQALLVTGDHHHTS